MLLLDRRLILALGFIAVLGVLVDASAEEEDEDEENEDNDNDADEGDAGGLGKWYRRKNSDCKKAELEKPEKNCVCYGYKKKETSTIVYNVHWRCIGETPKPEDDIEDDPEGLNDDGGDAGENPEDEEDETDGGGDGEDKKSRRRRLLRRRSGRWRRRLLKKL